MVSLLVWVNCGFDTTGNDRSVQVAASRFYINRFCLASSKGRSLFVPHLAPTFRLIQLLSTIGLNTSFVRAIDQRHQEQIPSFNLIRIDFGILDHGLSFYHE